MTDTERSILNATRLEMLREAGQAFTAQYESKQLRRWAANIRDVLQRPHDPPREKLTHWSIEKVVPK